MGSDRAASGSEAARQHASWDPNAVAWTQAVRSGAIASRRRGTDAAIVRACAVSRGLRVLDVGCGEGWLARALAEAGALVHGVDGSAGLIDAARAAGGATYDVVPYAELTSDAGVVAGPFDVIVCNFALLDEDVAPLFAALCGRLAVGGRLVIQTVHPFVAAGELGYTPGWREETFAGFGEGFRAPMPWFFRTLSGWFAGIGDAGLSVARLEEPRADDGAVLSLILECRVSN